MRNCIICFVASMTVFCCSDAIAQFNPRSNTALISTKVDTLQVIKKDANVINMKIYDEPYDKYLRQLQSKQRNWVQVKSGLKLTQSSFTNWAAGGNNAFAGRAHINVEHKYTSPYFNIHNIFDSAFGLQSSDGITLKNEDFFRLSTTPSWRFAEHWELSSPFEIKSQFIDSYVSAEDRTVTSTFFAPAYLNLSMGIKYNNTKKTLDLYFAPVSGNMIMVLDKMIADKGTFGEQGRQYIPQFMNVFKLRYKEQLFKNIMTVDTKFESYWDYSTVPRLIGEVKLDFQFTRILGASIYAMAIYDDKIQTPDVKEGKNNYLQFTENIGFGITYNFVTKSHPAPPEEPRKKIKKNRK